jgi:hypothetical protein
MVKRSGEKKWREEVERREEKEEPWREEVETSEEKRSGEM